MKAAIDLGTNTFHLLIAEVSGKNLKTVFQQQIPVKIGAGGIQHRIILKEAWDRGMSALEQFYKILQQYSISEVKATGTSAIRNAENGKDFLMEIRNRFGFEVEFITGEEEAEFIYTGVTASMTLPPEPVLVMDIGGGSVEFIIGKKETVLWKHSFEIGAARLLDRFKPSDPITVEETMSIEAYLFAVLIPLEAAVRQHQPKILIGSAGCFESILEVLQEEFGLSFQPDSLAHEIALEEVHRFLDRVISSTEMERRNIKGLVDFRVDMIVVAGLLIRHVLDRFAITHVVASQYALKEGLLLSR